MLILSRCCLNESMMLIKLGAPGRLPMLRRGIILGVAIVGMIGFASYYYLHLTPSCACKSTIDVGAETAFSLAFSSDGALLAAGSGTTVNNAEGRHVNAGAISIWKLANQHRTTLRDPSLSIVKSVAFFPGLRYRLVSTGGAFGNLLWDVSSKQVCSEKLGYGDRSVVISPNGRYLASDVENDIQLLEISGSKKEAMLRSHVAPVLCLAFSPDGKFLASGASDGSLKIWDCDQRRELTTLRGHLDQITSVGFSSDGKYLASSSWDLQVKLWDLVTYKERWTLSGGEYGVTSLSFSPANKHLLAVVFAPTTIKLLECETGRTLVVYKGHRRAITSLAFSPQGTILASGSRDGTIKLWDVP